MSQLLDDDSGSTGEKTCRNAEYQHEPTVGHMSFSPCVEAVNPSVYLVFEHDSSRFSAAKIGKSIKLSEKRQLFPYFRSLMNTGRETIHHESRARSHASKLKHHEDRQL